MDQMCAEKVSIDYTKKLNEIYVHQKSREKLICNIYSNCNKVSRGTFVLKCNFTVKTDNSGPVGILWVKKSNTKQ